MEIGFGVKGLIMKDNKLLFLVEPDGRLDLPGGRVKDGERLTEALRREILEETGLKVDILRPVNNWSFKKKSSLSIVGCTYLCRCNGVKVRLSREHVASLWLELDELSGFPVADVAEKPAIANVY